MNVIFKNHNFVYSILEGKNTATCWTDTSWNLDDFIGQKHLVGENSVLPTWWLIPETSLPLFCRDHQGRGKRHLHASLPISWNVHFTLSATGRKDVREVIEKAKSKPFLSLSKSDSFYRQIHRFKNPVNRIPLLGAVEKGTVTLIGATTKILPLKSLLPIITLPGVRVETTWRWGFDAAAQRTIENDLELKSFIDEKAGSVMQAAMLEISNILELVVEFRTRRKFISPMKSIKRLPKNPMAYDKDGEIHYDIISDLSNRYVGKAIGWCHLLLARMVCRWRRSQIYRSKMVISASRRCWFGQSDTLLLANAGFDALQKSVGLKGVLFSPENSYYLASSPKSNSAYMAIRCTFVGLNVEEIFPFHFITNAPTKLMKDLDYGKAINMLIRMKIIFVEQQFLPDQIKNEQFGKFRKKQCRTENGRLASFALERKILISNNVP